MCTPTLTVTEGLPGSSGAFEAITPGPGSVTVDMANGTAGLQGFTLISSSNAIVTIPPFQFGTTGPVTATFTRPNPGLPVDFTLRAASRPYAVTIRAQCGTAARAEEVALRSIVPDVSFWFEHQETTRPGVLLGSIDGSFGVAKETTGN